MQRTTPYIIQFLYRRFRSLLSFAIFLWLGIAQGCKAQTLSWNTLKVQIRDEFPTVEHISIEDFEQRLHEIDPTRMLIVDVREPEEFAVSHLKHAVNLEDSAAILDLVQHQQAEHIILYCSVGYRSAKIAQNLEQRGLDDVVNLEGSIFEWANSGRPVYVENEAVEVVHPFDQFWGQLLDSHYHPAGF